MSFNCGNFQQCHLSHNATSHLATSQSTLPPRRRCDFLFRSHRFKPDGANWANNTNDAQQKDSWLVSLLDVEWGEENEKGEKPKWGLCAHHGSGGSVIDKNRFFLLLLLLRFVPFPARRFALSFHQGRRAKKFQICWNFVDGELHGQLQAVRNNDLRADRWSSRRPRRSTTISNLHRRHSEQRNTTLHV